MEICSGHQLFTEHKESRASSQASIKLRRDGSEATAELIAGRGNRQNQLAIQLFS